MEKGTSDRNSSAAKAEPVKTSSEIPEKSTSNSAGDQFASQLPIQLVINLQRNARTSQTDMNKGFALLLPLSLVKGTQPGNDPQHRSLNGQWLCSRPL